MSNGNRKTVVQFGTHYIMQLTGRPGTLFWTCALAVDADGAPNCYHPHGSPPGLDFLANAGKPGNWWGIACDEKGNPYVQSGTDPCPGFYVSTTALTYAVASKSNPERYIDSRAVPFFVLPGKPKFDSAQGLGDLSVIFNHKTGKCTWAVYADVGPANQLGEGSMKLNELLGLSSDPKRGGTSSEDIAMVYFPGSNLIWPAGTEVLENRAWKLFSQWGGFASASLALPQIDWTRFVMPTLDNPPPAPEPPPAETPIVTISVTVPKGVIVNVIQNPSPEN